MLLFCIIVFHVCVVSSVQEQEVKDQSIEQEKNFGNKLGQAASKGFINTISQFLKPRKKERKPAPDRQEQSYNDFIQEIFAGKEAPIPKGEINVVRTVKLNKAVFNTTALMAAVIAGNSALVTYLLDNHADPDIKNIDGITALHLAARGGKDELVKILLDRGADPNSADKHLMTPLIYAVMKNQNQSRYNIIKMLLEHSADSNLPNNKGTTPLMMAALNDDFAVVELLLEYHADPSRKNLLGQEAFGLTDDKKVRELLGIGRWLVIPSVDESEEDLLLPSFGW